MTYNSYDNSKVVEIMKRGDKSAFAQVYSFYYQPLCSFCSNYVSHEEAEEIVQDLMLYVWEKRETLNEHLSLKTFLFTAAKNRALNVITRNNMICRINEEYQKQVIEEDEIFDYTQESELFAAYVKAMKELPEEQLQVYMMSRYKHLTHKEIANELNVSVQTVNYRMGKVLDFFRIRMKELFKKSY